MGEDNGAGSGAGARDGKGMACAADSVTPPARPDDGSTLEDVPAGGVAAASKNEPPAQSGDSPATPHSGDSGDDWKYDELDREIDNIIRETDSEIRRIEEEARTGQPRGRPAPPGQRD